MPQRTGLKPRGSRAETLALFRHYPELSGSEHYRSLGVRPTPVHRAPALETATGNRCRIFVKRDDLSSASYGGNKARKLEFVLGRARSLGAKRIFTAGGIGSNLALATATYCESLGLECELVLFDHPRSPGVERHLLRIESTSARVHRVATPTAMALTLGRVFARARIAYGLGRAHRPFLMLPGASDALSGLAYVNAGLELSEQIEAGILPLPDDIFLPAGSCGTLAGLVVGLRLAGCRSRAIGVRVAPATFCNARTVRRLANGTLSRLQKRIGRRLPCKTVSARDFALRGDFMGDGYGHHTVEGHAAIRTAAHAGLQLDDTYGGKAMAALLSHARSTDVADRTLLFINTFDPRSHADQKEHHRDLADPSARGRRPAGVR